MSILGKTDDGREIKLNDKKRTRGLYCIGTNGTGKTTFLVNLALQDMQNGHGLCYIDPHGDAIRDMLKRLPRQREEDVIHLKLDDSLHFGLNLFDCPDPASDKQVALTSSFVIHVFERIWGAGLEGGLATQYARIAQFIRNISVTMISNPSMTFAEIPLLLNNKRVRDKLVANVRSEEVRQFWQSYDMLRGQEQLERSAPVYSRVDAFLTQPIIRNIIGQSKTTINFDWVMNEGKILFIELSPRFEDITKLLGTIIIGRFLDSAYARAEKTQQERRFFGLYVDEFQWYVNRDMEALLTEARKFNVGMVIAHQVRDQLDTKTRAATLNVGNLVVFKVIGPDGKELAPQFNNTPPQAKVIGQRPVLTPKREVIEHLLQNGHSNPRYLKGAKFLIALKEVAGQSVERPHFRQISNFDKAIPENFIAIFQQKQAAKQYEQATLAKTDLRITIQRLNNFFYEVIQERNSNKFLNHEDLATIFKAFDVLDLVMKAGKQNHAIFGLLGSYLASDLAEADLALQRVADGYTRRMEQYRLITQIVGGLRSLVTLLAGEPILVPSGQYEDIYDHERAYADVQNQIATELVNLPKFKARVKLEYDEYTIKTMSFIPPVIRPSVDILQGRLPFVIYNNSVYQCVRKKEAVEKEIRKRQEDLQNPPEPPAGSRIVDIDI